MTYTTVSNAAFTLSRQCHYVVSSSPPPLPTFLSMPLNPFFASYLSSGFCRVGHTGYSCCVCYSLRGSSRRFPTEQPKPRLKSKTSTLIATGARKRFHCLLPRSSILSDVSCRAPSIIRGGRWRRACITAREFAMLLVCVNVHENGAGVFTSLPPVPSSRSDKPTREARRFTATVRGYGSDNPESPAQASREWYTYSILYVYYACT